MKRFTGIICTLGPSSSNEEIIAKMAENGMDIARINFSHGSHESNKRLIDLIRKVNKKYNYNVKVLQDLEGYRIRVGYFRALISLKPGQIVYMSNKTDILRPDVIPFDFTGNIELIKRNMDMFIDDGKLYLKVVSHINNKLKLKVIQGGILKERKGINIPRLKLESNILTEKDKKDLEFGIQNNVDFVAQSFVRNKRDIQRISKIVKSKLPECKVISKIESIEGVKNVDSIIDASDGVMIARGDLGVSLPIYKIPIIQKYIIQRCNRMKKYAITATQMLDSMIENSRPTRAEVSDVANAILDETDYVMLSGETAAGKYPCKSIDMMRQIINFTESYEKLRLL